jgi:NADH-quinone oxidoreductase subunit N
MWISLELNILRFLPIISSKENIEIENSIKYFLVQRWASVIFLSRFFFFNMVNNSFYLLINLSIFIKLGIRPFHSWFISILKTRSLTTLFILSTVQKIIPLVILFNIKTRNYLIFVVIFLTLFFILILLPRTLNINKVLAISSITNVIWLLISVLFSLKLIFLFMRVYMFLLIGFVILYNFYGSSIFTQINSSAFSDKFFMVIVFMSLGGMPPLLGFFSKILILKILINNFIRLSIIFGIIMCSLLLLYFYLSRIYFYLRNIPSLKTGLRLRKFSLKKTLYVISLIYFNLFFIIYI